MEEVAHSLVVIDFSNARYVDEVEDNITRRDNAFTLNQAETAS